MRKIFASFVLAFQNIRSNFFHTVFSTLGIVIGIAALVAILSLIDALEHFAKSQIRTTAGLSAVNINGEAYKWSNGVRVPKEEVAVMKYEQLPSLQAALSKPATLYIWHVQSSEVIMDSIWSVGAVVRATGENLYPDAMIEEGRLFTEEDIKNKAPYALVNRAFLRAIANPQYDVVGKDIVFRDDTLKVIGVLLDTVNRNPHLFIPITRVDTSLFLRNPPFVSVEADNVEDVTTLKEESEAWIKQTFPGHQYDFTLATNDFRVRQAAKGLLIFRLVMGIIITISVFVGGIGVTNVLLISITQRSSEIGIRRALGASKRDITVQFLVEAITVSLIGTMIGVILGVAFTLAFIPFIRLFVDTPFEAHYTWVTLAVVFAIALGVGILFGTYPARRASKLKPAEALRRE